MKGFSFRFLGALTIAVVALVAVAVTSGTGLRGGGEVQAQGLPGGSVDGTMMGSGSSSGPMSGPMSGSMTTPMSGSTTASCDPYDSYCYYCMMHADPAMCQQDPPYVMGADTGSSSMPPSSTPSSSSSGSSTAPMTMPSMAAPSSDNSSSSSMTMPSMTASSTDNGASESMPAPAMAMASAPVVNNAPPLGAAWVYCTGNGNGPFWMNPATATSNLVC